MLERDQKNQDAIEHEKAKLVKFTEEKNNEILYYNNQLAQLQTRLDEAQSRAVRWESKYAHIQVRNDLNFVFLFFEVVVLCQTLLFSREYFIAE